MSENVELEEHECPSCHVLYWISKAHDRRLVKSKESFYCPNGHCANYLGKSDKEKLREAQQKSDEQQNEIDGYKEQIEKLKKKKKVKK